MKTLTFHELGDYFWSQKVLCRKQNQDVDTVKITFHEPAASRAINELKTNENARPNVFPPIFPGARQVRFGNVFDYDELSSRGEFIEWFHMYNAMHHTTCLSILGMEIGYRSLKRLFAETVYDRLRIGRIIVKSYGIDDSVSLDVFQGNMDRLGLICPDVYISLHPGSNFSHLRNVLHVQKVCTLWNKGLDHVLHNADETVNKDVEYFIEKAKHMCDYAQWFAGVETPNIPLVSEVSDV
jgi:hypothetical protein